MEFKVQTMYTIILMFALAENVIGIISMPSECDGQKFCTVKSTEYPSDEIISDILEKAKLRSVLEVNLSNRQGPNEVVDTLCKVNYTTDLIIYHIEHNGVKSVIQKPGTFEQKISLSTCMNPGTLPYDNSIIENESLDRFPVYCKEITTAYNFLVVGQKGELELASIELPSGCVCVYDYDN